MATTTHRIAINATSWTNVSNGNLNCCIMIGALRHIRIAIADSASPPADDTPDYIPVQGPALMPQMPAGKGIVINNLVAGDDVFVRSGDGDAFVHVMRGDAYISGA